MKKFLKSLSCAALALSLSLTAGCSSGGGTEKKQAGGSSAPSGQTASAPKSNIGTLALPYNSVAKFNPLLPISKSNMNLWPLIYDCLSEPDDGFNPVMRLAAAVKNVGTEVTVTLRSGVKFTDGDALKASDAKYSLELALLNADSPYHERLLNVASITASGMTLRIALKTPDPLFANLLDIPIIKAESEHSGNAIGTGRYKYARNGVNAVLTPNQGFYGGGTTAFSKINLVNIPNSNAIMSTLAIGDINYTYSDDGSESAASAPNTDTAPVNFNHLVYIGVNASRKSLGNANVRKALSLSVNRTLLTSQIYSGRAYPSIYPFNPRWSLLPAQTDKQLSSDFDAASDAVKLAGGADSISALTLIVNSENQVRVSAAKFVASSIAKSGLTVNVKSMPFAQYDAAVKSGDFDLYLGEIKLSNNMDLSPLLVPGGTAAYGTLPNSLSLSAFEDYRAGTKSVKDAASAFSDELPLIPLCFRTGTTSFTRGLGGVEAHDNNIFYNFEKWSK